MVSFGQIPSSVASEFLRADIIARHTYKSQSTEEWLPIIRACFSSSTRELYHKEVSELMSLFLRNQQHRTAKVAAGVLPDSKRPASLSNYLLSYLREFSNFADLPLMTSHEMDLYWESKRQSLEKVCQQYKTIRIAEGMTAAIIDGEIDTLMQKVDTRLEGEKKRALETMEQFRKMVAIFFPEYLDLGRATLAVMERFLLARSDIEFILDDRKLRAASLNTAQPLFHAFITILSQLPKNDVLLKGALHFMSPFLTGRTFFPVHALLCRLFQTDISALTLDLFLKQVELNLPETPEDAVIHIFDPEDIGQLKKNALTLYQQVHHLFVNAKCSCQSITAPYYQTIQHFLHPITIPEVLALLNSGTIETLEGMTEEQATQFFSIVLTSVSKVSPDTEIARIVDDACFAYQYMQKQQIDSKLIFSAIAFAAQCTVTKQRTNPFINPFFLFTHFSHNDLKVFLSFLEQAPRCDEHLELFFLRGGKSLTRFDALEHLPFVPACPLSEEVITLLITLPDAEFQDFIFFYRRRAFTSESLSEIEIHRLLQDRTRCSFLKRLWSTHHTQSFTSINALYTWLQSPVTNVPDEVENAFWSHFLQLTPDERYLFAKFSGLVDSSLLFCCSEASGHLEQDISCVDLSQVPIGPLIRFFGSKPFLDIKSWLETKVSLPLGEEARINTLSEPQIRNILFSFRRTDTSIPLPTWMELFKVSDEEARKLSRQDESPLSPELEAYHTLLQVNIDGNDPFSLLQYESQYHKQTKRTTLTLMRIVRDLLLSARVTNICGEKLILTWGNTSVTSSHCVSQECQPLHTQSLKLFPRDLFNDIDFSASSVTLRKRLLSLRETNNGAFLRLVNAQSPDDLIYSEETELFLELVRIAEHLAEQYPRLPHFISQSVDGDDQSSIFLSYLKDLYQNCIPDGSGYDCNNYTHRHAFTFLSLLQIARSAVISDETDPLIVTLDNGISFRLKELPRKGLSFPTEINPGITNPGRVAADYPLHTLSPITPKEVSPSEFALFAASIQSLTEEQFSALCDSCTLLVPMALPDTSTTLDYCEAWKTVWPAGFDISQTTHVHVSITQGYITSVDRYTEELLPDTTYHFNPTQIGAFCPESQVPEFLRTQGNFASLICASFIPHDPEDHEGSCGVNAFLLGRHGVTVYSSGERSLHDDIMQFRTDIVAYATEHRNELSEEFGTKTITDLVDKYATLNADWSGREVWAIASRRYGHPIKVYTCQDHGGLFRTNEQRIIVPFDETTECFYPKDPATQPTIHLMLSDDHYYYLEARS